MSRDLESDYKPYQPTADQARRMEAIRLKAKDLAYTIYKMVPGSREQSSALTKLDEVVFWVNAGITRNEGGPNGQVDEQHAGNHTAGSRGG